MISVRPQDLRVSLQPSMEDRQSPDAYRKELAEFYASAEARECGLSRRNRNPGQIFNYSILDAIGQFAVAHIDKVVPLLIGWLAGRNGRKVKLKIGDIEAEARTEKELTKLLDKAQEIQRKSEPRKIHEP